MRNSQNQFKMKEHILLFVVFGLIALVSCSPAQKDSKQQTVQQQKQVQQTAVKPTPDATTTSVPVTATPAEPSIVKETATPPKLNPPHGQPYHRCDIAVGSPLSSAPAKPTSIVTSLGGAPTLENAARLSNPQAKPTLVPNSSAPTVTNASGTPPKLNPPHGQPFHKCEIPVGSPLN
ncbi:MAG: hypothetical protein Q8M67_04200 [Bacteroidota bacterium]|nr:hypothetical protein [Bacteroidota bacterium]